MMIIVIIIIISIIIIIINIHNSLALPFHRPSLLNLLDNRLDGIVVIDIDAQSLSKPTSMFLPSFALRRNQLDICAKRVEDLEKLVSGE